MKQNKIEHLIDFLVVGARLVFIKSRALLPQAPTLPLDEEEEDPAEALIRQLRMYKQFKDAASWLKEREEQGIRTYLRVAPPPRMETKLDLTGVTSNTLFQALWDVLNRADALEESVEVVQQRRMTIEGQLEHLRNAIRLQEFITFKELLSQAADRVEVAVTLLATLELIKRREVVAHQQHLFGPIEIRAYEASANGSSTSQSTRQTDQ